MIPHNLYIKNNQGEVSYDFEFKDKTNEYNYHFYQHNKDIAILYFYEYTKKDVPNISSYNTDAFLAGVKNTAKVIGDVNTKILDDNIQYYSTQIENSVSGYDMEGTAIAYYNPNEENSVFLRHKTNNI